MFSEPNNNILLRRSIAYDKRILLSGLLNFNFFLNFEAWRVLSSFKFNFPIKHRVHFEYFDWSLVFSTFWLQKLKLTAQPWSLFQKIFRILHTFPHRNHVWRIIVQSFKKLIYVLQISFVYIKYKCEKMVQKMSFCNTFQCL